MRNKVCIVIIAVVITALIKAPASAKVLSDYGITDAEQTVINASSTTATVDIINNEIRLPEDAGRCISFMGDTYDYVVMTENGVEHYSFTGSGMAKNSVTSISGLSNPLAVFSSGQYPDVVVASETKVDHYSFTGGGMAQNPALSVLGLTDVYSVSSKENNDIAVLDGGGLSHYMFDGSGMAKVGELSIGRDLLNNPVEVALFQDTYDLAVLEENKVRFYYFTGGGLSEAPDMAISGFANPLKSLAVSEGTVSVVEGDAVRTYIFDGGGYASVSALSVTSGLTSPSCVALRPGSHDMIIADGNKVKYYMFDGGSMVYNESLSVQVANLAGGGKYKKDAVVESNAIASSGATATRLTAYCEAPEGTSITWSIYLSGNWEQIWRVRGLAGGAAVAEYRSGVNWVNLGSLTAVEPGSDTTKLWREHSAVNSVKWRAELTTENTKITPKILAKGSGSNRKAIRIETNKKPTVEIIGSDNLFLTMTPTIKWTFSDGDGDTQKEYDFRICDTGNIDNPYYAYPYPNFDLISGRNTGEHTMLPAEDISIASGIWRSGKNAFKLYLRVHDGTQWSDWINRNVEFRAFERPRVTEIAVPGNGYIHPEQGQVIKKGMTVDGLPTTKAGGMVTLKIDSVGEMSIEELALVYGDSKEATIVQEMTPGLNPAAGNNKAWEVSFYTDPSKVICPDNTLVTMQLTGNSGVYKPVFNCPDFAAGVVKTKGTVLDNWIVVLQGSQQ